MTALSVASTATEIFLANFTAFYNFDNRSAATMLRMFRLRSWWPWSVVLRGDYGRSEFKGLGGFRSAALCNLRKVLFSGIPSFMVKNLPEVSFFKFYGSG